MDTLRIARDLSEGNVFSHEQAERLGNAFATYRAEVRSGLVTREYLDARLVQLTTRFDGHLAHRDPKFESLLARLETRMTQVQNRIIATQVVLSVLLCVEIYLK